MKHEGKIQPKVKIQPKHEFKRRPKTKKEKKTKKPKIQSNEDEVCKETKLKSSNSYTVNVVGFRVQISNCIVVVGLSICSPKQLLRENILFSHIGFNNGHGLCLVEISTGHVRIQTHVQDWTYVHNPTCLVETSTGHKPDPLIMSF